MSEKMQFKSIHFVTIGGHPKKTREWECKDNWTEWILGKVKWYEPLQQYCFFPNADVYSPGCLEDIAVFIRSLNHERRIAVLLKKGSS